MQNLDNPKLDELLKEYDRICELLTYEEIILDKKLFLKYQNRQLSLQNIVLDYKEYIKLSNYINELEGIKNSVESKEIEVYENEIIKSKEKLLKLDKKLVLLFNELSFEHQRIILEIDFKKSEELIDILIQGYSCFCDNNGFDYKLTKSLDKAIFVISGKNVKQIFLNEKGLHLMSEKIDEECQVYIYDDYEKEYIFDEKDLKILTFRSSGAGGQHINTTDSAVRVIHKPTGISVVCQSERSQNQNKQKAIFCLKEKLEKLYSDERNDFINKQKSKQFKHFKNKKTKVYKNDKIIKSKNEFLLLDKFLKGKEI